MSILTCESEVFNFIKSVYPNKDITKTSNGINTILKFVKIGVLKIEDTSIVKNRIKLKPCYNKIKDKTIIKQLFYACLSIYNLPNKN